jgi:hypothetical protein
VGGGGGGIRTHGRLSPTSVFKTGAFDHSATPPTIATLNWQFSILKVLIFGPIIAEMPGAPFHVATVPLSYCYDQAIQPGIIRQNEQGLL